MIELIDLSFSYSKDKIIVDNINLRIQNNSAIIGPNGSGKTTLLYLILGLLKGKGKIKVNNVEVEKKNLRKIRKMIGFVFQNPDNQLICPIVFDDIAFGLRNIGLNGDGINKKVSKILKRFDIYDLRNRFVHELSFGEKRLISLLSVLVMEPEIIILDEPTLGLDSKFRYYIYNILKDLDIQKIIVSHDFEFLKWIVDDVFILYNNNVFFNNGIDILENDNELKNFNLFYNLM